MENIFNLQNHLTNRFLIVCLDTCYVLSFSVIMLNTSLHNPSVKDKVRGLLSMSIHVDSPFARVYT